MERSERELLEHFKRGVTELRDAYVQRDIGNRLGAVGRALLEHVDEVLTTVDVCLSSDRLTGGDQNDILAAMDRHDELADKIIEVAPKAH